MASSIALASLFVALAGAQQIGTLTPETHPSMTWQTCTAPGSCTTIAGTVTIDANWRWTHSVSGSTNCYTGNTWDTTLCPDDTTCAKNCALDGASYTSTYGVTASGNSLKLQFVTGANVGSRLFLMADETHYQTFNLLNKEFTFDVDVSHLPCGLNGALYMSAMAADGGVSKYPGNKAGAKYGTGYCDAQCPRDLKYIGGQANVDGWDSASNSANSGTGAHGTCCAEMDIWEANSISTALTPHSCTTVTPTICTGDECGGTYSTDRYSGTCDPDGCDFNSYRQGNTTFYGPGKTVNTNAKFTVVTQFLTDTGTDSGTLNEIKRFYVQNGVVIPNSQSNIAGVTGNSINAAYCTAQKTAFGDTNDWEAKGAFAGMTAAFKTGMVLVMSLWDDYAVSMQWLDGTLPVGSTAPGSVRGDCSASSGLPKDVEAQSGSSYVIYSNIKVGPLGSTFSAPPGTGGSSSVGSGSSTKSTSATSKATSTTTSKTTSTTSKTTTTSAASGGGAAHYGQCGGQGWTGPTTCVAPYTCKASGIYYSQCL